MFIWTGFLFRYKFLHPPRPLLQLILIFEWPSKKHQAPHNRIPPSVRWRVFGDEGVTCAVVILDSQMAERLDELGKGKNLRSHVQREMKE